MSRRQALWQEHRRTDSYLSWIVRDVVGLVADLLGIDLRDMSATRVIDSCRGLPNIHHCLHILHVHRRLDGEILFLMNNWRADELELRNRVGQVVWSDTQILKIEGLQANQLLYICPGKLYSLDYETLQRTEERDLIDLTNYLVLAFSRTHMVLYQDNNHYFIYDLGCQVVTPVPPGLFGGWRNFSLTSTHFFAYEVDQGSQIVGINLTTFQIDYRSKPSVILNTNYVFTESVILRNTDRKSCILQDLRDGTILRTFVAPRSDQGSDQRSDWSLAERSNQSSDYRFHLIYRRDDQYYLIYYYEDTTSVTYQFME